MPRLVCLNAHIARVAQVELSGASHFVVWCRGFRNCRPCNCDTCNTGAAVRAAHPMRAHWSVACARAAHR